MEETRLHERVSSLEANFAGMNKSVDNLSGSIQTLNDKLEKFSGKFSAAVGISLAGMFVVQSVVLPLMIWFITKRA